ncbi:MULTISPECIES: phage terminase small subunit P27 family [Convivina]|uniref:phage terminase small subunit P27 family n=1 Tax=Convivina TaxID=1697027 RepID=UPI00200D05FD|nr:MULTISPECIES: phage terminase small subunit P27 family [Convivina]CAH1855192.1 hypothetical protein R078138_01078 [Convivina sp. LMG 32447]CAH1857521.1 hypothetical protein R077811_01550 [Convivina intestini]
MTKKPDYAVNGGKLRTNPPDYFSKQSGIVWRKVVGFLETKSNVIRVDSVLVETYCTQYEIYRNAYMHIRKHGEVQAMYDPVQDMTGKVIEHTFKGFKRNPMTQIYSDSIKNLTKIGSELGLSPKSRQELFDGLTDGDDQSATAEIMQLFQGNE